MELVGATNNMIVTPLLLEGATQGIVGAGLATVALAIAYSISGGFVKNFTVNTSPGPFPFVSTIIVLGTIGLIYGLVCSIIAIREPKQKEIPR